MKIALVGEAPNDTTAVRNLLSQKYKDLSFTTLLERITGSMLDNARSLELLRKEFLSQKPDLVIFIRDLDALEKTGKLKLAERVKKFNASNKIVQNKGILMLNIYELEALILADIGTFNKHYGCSLVVDDPMKVPEPKEFLIRATKSGKRFTIAHNPQLFSLLRFNIVRENCKCFSSFLEAFELAIVN